MGLCNCNNKTNAIKSSDLFVPKLDVTLDKSKQKKHFLLKADVISKSKNPLLTTEALYHSKDIRSSIRKIKTYGSNDVQVKLQVPLEKSFSLNINQNINENNHSFRKNTHKQEKSNIFCLETKEEENKDNEEHTKKFLTTAPKKNQSDKVNKIECEISELPFNQNEENLIVNILLSHYLFHRATNEQLIYLLGEINEFQVDENTYIFKEGDEGTCMFIVKSGEIEIFSKDKEERITFTEGDTFGEIALVKEGIKRTYSAKSMTNVSFYILEQSSFIKIKKEMIIGKKFRFDLLELLDPLQREMLYLLQTQIEIQQGQEIRDLKGILGVEMGSLLLRYKNNDIAVFKEKDVIGVKNAIYGNKNNNYENMILITKEKSICYVLRSNAFIEVFGLEYNNELMLLFFKNALCQNYHFCFFAHDNEIKKLFNQFKIKEMKKGDVIRKEKNYTHINNHIINIIIHGIAKFGYQSFSVGYIIGEEVLSGKKIKGDIIIQSDNLYLLTCQWNTFKLYAKMLGMSLSQALSYAQETQMFSKVPEWKMFSILKYAKSELYNKNDIIISYKSKNDKVYFIYSGNVKYKVNNKKVREYSKGNSFGEIEIFHEGEAKCEVIVSSQVLKVFSFSKENFYSLMGYKYFNTFTKRKICLEDSEILPNGLYYLSTLCKSITSNVYLVHNRIFLYVIKAVNVEIVNNRKTFDLLLNEKKSSKRLNHPFLLHYVKTLKNLNWCFFLEEYIKGITLQEYIYICKPFGNLNLILFYAGCFAIILDALQSYGIIHRDIKPENIILDLLGYPRLIDFSSSKRIKNGITKTLIGTPAFIAPEVLSGKGYNYSCDYWSVGVLLFYLYYGYFPFGSTAKKPEAVYKEILNKNLIFDSKGDDALNNLISNLLNKNVKERYTSFENIKSDPFLKDVEWDKLKKMKIKSPFIPQVVQISEEKMLNNLSSPFMQFISKDKVEIYNTSREIKDDSLYNERSFVYSSIYENEDKQKGNFKMNSNWFDEF